jgi:hypothetical protein
MGGRVERGLDVPGAVGPRVLEHLAHQPFEVLLPPQHLGRRFVGRLKRGEIAEGADLRHRRPMLRAKVRKRRRPHRRLEVEMQMALRQSKERTQKPAAGIEPATS